MRNIEGLEFKAGQTVTIPREDLNILNIAGIPPENDVIAFLATVAEDPNTVGVAISKMHSGIYTAWFVNNFRDKPAMQRTLSMTNDSYRFLEKISGDRAGYGGFISLGGLPFEEVESIYRSKFGKVDNEDPFGFGRPFHEGLGLQVIFRFT